MNNISGEYYIDPSVYGKFEPIQVTCKFHIDHAETCLSPTQQVYISFHNRPSVLRLFFFSRQISITAALKILSRSCALKVRQGY